MEWDYRTVDLEVVVWRSFAKKEFLKISQNLQEKFWTGVFSRIIYNIYFIELLQTIVWKQFPKFSRFFCIF